jgi:ABC-type transport system involved in multi-copper enzyme maturation permease subunit
MSSGAKKAARANPSWMTRFSAIVKYELLWNIRKKKFLGVLVVAFVFATLSLTLVPILRNVSGEEPVGPDPDYVVSSGAGIGGFGMFLFAVVAVMNSISGEFESGTIVPLLTKPVSRTMVFLGKLFAAFITLLSAYAVLFVYITIGGTIVYGPQNNLYLVPLSLLGSILSTFVWIGIVLALGSLSKSSLLAALGGLGIFVALLISAPIVSLFSNQAWVLTYVPGSGATGYIEGLGTSTQLAPGMSVSTGTDNIAPNLITYILHPSVNVTFYNIASFAGQNFTLNKLYELPLSFVLLRSIAVAVAYILVFLFIAWYALKRAQVLE